jgi:hypothetical protein
MNDSPWIRRGFFIVLALFLVLYVLFQSKNLIEGPLLTVSKPLDGETLTYSAVDVEGTAKNISYIYLNDHPIFVDTEGNFRETVIAPVGYSIIKVSAKDKFGRTKETYIHVVLPGETPFPALQNLLPNASGNSSTTTASSSKKL